MLLKARQRAGLRLRVYSTNKWIDIAKRWAGERLEDEARTCELVRLACQRFFDDLKSKQWNYKPEYVAEACEFFEKMPPPSGEQFGSRLQIAPWQVFMLANVEGFRKKGAMPKGVRPRRRFNIWAFWTARKSGKSATAAVALLKDLTIENRLNSRQISVARTKEQAGHVLDSAISMAQQCPALREKFKLRVSKMGISRLDERGGRLHAIAGKPDAQDGHRPTLTALDEVHALNDFNLYNVILTAFGTSYSWLLMMPSTTGHNLESVGYRLYEMQEDMLRGRVDLDEVFTLPFIPDKGADPYIEDTWWQANPGLGMTVDVDYYRGQAIVAEKSREHETFFITRQCNMWRGTSGEQWLDLDQWNLCADEEMQIMSVAGQAEACFVGVDASAVDDLTAVCIMFVMPNEELRCFFEIYCPSKTIKRKADEGDRRYDAWKASGELKVCGDDRIDYVHVAKRCVFYVHTYKAQRIVFDQFASVGIISRETPYIIREDKLRMLQKTARNVTESCRDLEARVVSNIGLRHDGNKVAAWCVNNTYVKRFVDESLVPQKDSEHSLKKKIDAVDAMVLANAGRFSSKAGMQVTPIDTQRKPQVITL